ncbi:hypothetical protein TNCV_2001931 [Trichonephila clavipes]|nr:hypothetical protein TNCV_2001931 [Trichonephila clavipes]
MGRVGVIGSTRNGHLDTRCPSARRLAVVQEYIRARREGAACVWTADNEAVGSTHACRMTFQSSQVSISQMPPEPGHRVTDLFFIHWSSQSNQNGQLDGLLTKLTTQLLSSR